MSKRILLEERDGVRTVALMDDKHLLYYAKESQGGVEAEQIYLGVVDRIIRGMEASFVRIGKDLMGYLPFSECKERPKSGDKILVQVKKPPIGEKAAYLTADLSIAGRYAILTPITPRYSVSKRIENGETKDRLYQLAHHLAPKGMGIVLRNEAAEAEEECIAAEVQILLEKWQAILAASHDKKAPCLAEGREDAVTRLIRDEQGGIDEMHTNIPDKFSHLSLPVYFCANAFSLHNVESKLHKSWQRKIWLDCGGFLVIDRTEAMTVIDVNSGKFTGNKSGTEHAFLKLNVEAAKEIARLLRLRGIGGMILVDFVDMQLEDSRLEVLSTLEASFRDDPVKTTLHGFTKLGLMEITRKKTDESSSPLPICPRCHGTGIIEEKV